MKFFLRFGHLITLFLILLFAVICVYKSGMLDRYQESQIIKSDIDYDNDGIDDYTDILDGAHEFIAKKPKYKSKYYESGYPNDEYYVCTDLIWYALDHAGYNLKDMMDEDIKKNKKDYNIDVADPNIDFRRVRNIKVFLDKYSEVLTTDIKDVEAFKPGDIVVFSNSHIAIVSNKEKKNHEKYIIHHDGFHNYEEAGLSRNTLVGHYRWRIATGEGQEKA